MVFKIGGGSEDTAGNHISLHFGKPQLDLVEPGRVSRRRVESDVGMLIEESRHLLRLVGREIIKDDVNLAVVPSWPPPGR